MKKLLKIVITFIITLCVLLAFCIDPGNTALPEPIPHTVKQAYAPVIEPAEPEQTLSCPFSPADVDMMAKTVWGEARGMTADEQRLVVWTVLQRLDGNGWGDTISAVLTAPNQFLGYRAGHPINEQIHAVCLEEMQKWASGAEPPTHEIYAPTAPYYYFEGYDGHNWFRGSW